ncbi:MAG: hypothetical protein AAFQ89_14965, partial [Cyanobacteria bacterium J06626_18]
MRLHQRGSSQGSPTLHRDRLTTATQIHRHSNRYKEKPMTFQSALQPFYQPFVDAARLLDEYGVA